MDYIGILGLLLLAALNVLQFVLAFKERQKLLDRVQSRSLPEYKAMEAKEAKKDEKKEPVQPVDYV